MPEKRSVFDMIGPVMIGPSSSHTAGVVRIGLTARWLLGEQPTKAEIVFYNSFASTYQGHGSDRAVIAGLLNMKPDDPGIREALKQATDCGLSYTFKAVPNASSYHPNTVHITIYGKKRNVSVVGVSKGGGVINMENFCGFDTNFSTTLHTLIVLADDVKGSVAFIADVVAHDDCNIATMSVSRKGKDDLACLVIEIDTGIRDITHKYLTELKWVKEVIYLPNLTDQL